VNPIVLLALGGVAIMAMAGKNGKRGKVMIAAAGEGMFSGEPEYLYSSGSYDGVEWRIGYTQVQELDVLYVFFGPWTRGADGEWHRVCSASGLCAPEETPEGALETIQSEIDGSRFDAEAITFCEMEGGTVEPRHGGFTLMCVFPDGREVDARAFFSGEAVPAFPGGGS
jgi:putative hemolysin